MSEIQLGDITRETFAGLETQEFDFHLGEKSVRGTLVEVKHLGERVVPGATRDPFSLLFRLPQGSAEGSFTCPIEHDRLGRLELHMTAVLPLDEEHNWIEILFT